MTTAPLLHEPLPVELVNTVWADRGGVHDALAEPGGATAWLRAVCQRVELLSPTDLDALGNAGERALAQRLRHLRDALRRLAAQTTADPRPAATSASADVDAAVAAVNEAAPSAIAEGAVHLFSDPERRALRACLAPGCVLCPARDHPRREWCCAPCGNRARAARHYRRHRAAAR